MGMGAEKMKIVRLGCTLPEESWKKGSGRAVAGEDTEPGVVKEPEHFPKFKEVKSRDTR